MKLSSLPLCKGIIAVALGFQDAVSGCLDSVSSLIVIVANKPHLVGGFNPIFPFAILCTGGTWGFNPSEKYESQLG